MDQTNITTFHIYVAFRDLGFMRNENKSVIWHQCNRLKSIFEDWIINESDKSPHLYEQIEAFAYYYTNKDGNIDLY